MKTKEEIEKQFSNECSILIERGKLIEDWSNVYNHCITVAQAASCISELINLSNKDENDLVKGGILHDWYKRVERESADKEGFEKYNETQKKSFTELIKIGIDFYVSRFLKIPIQSILNFMTLGVN